MAVGSTRLCALAMLLVALGGCGQSESQRVESVVRDYLDALAERDGKRACGHLTRAAQERAWRSNRVHAGEDHPDQACARVVKEGFFPIWGLKRLRQAGIGRIRVDGDFARTRVDGFPARLLKVDGEWKLDVHGLGNRVGDSPPRRRRS